MAVTEQAQTATDERVIEHPAVLEALEERHELKAKARAAAKRAEGADERVKTMLEEFQLPEECVVRIGRFRITRTLTEGRDVAFHVEAKQRTTFAVKDEA